MPLAAGQEWTFQRLGKLFTVPQQPCHSYTSDLADEMSSSIAFVPTVWGPEDPAFPRSGVDRDVPTFHSWIQLLQPDPRAGRELQGGTAIPYWKICLVCVFRTILSQEAQSSLLLVGKRHRLPIGYHETYAEKDRYPDLKDQKGSIRKES